MGFRKEFRNQPLTALSAAAGALVTLFGFGATVYQLSQTASALQASTVYEIQKDGRELVAELESHEDFGALVSGAVPKDRKKALQDLWLMANFYLSVYRQAEAQGVSHEFVTSFSRDFCDFVAKTPIDAAWQEMIAAKQLGDPHKKMRERWCNVKTR